VFDDIYYTLKANSEGLYKEKGSKFIAHAYPVKTETDIKEILATLRKTYHDARHHCYAYILGYDKSAYRVNDDGEPSGTAGKPIYGQLLSHDLTNVLVVVIRYFGGTLLGVSGLIRAYKLATKDAIDNATIIEKTVKDVYTIAFTYEAINDVMKCLKDNEVDFMHQKFELTSEITFAVRKMHSNKIYEMLKKIHDLKITYNDTI